IANALTLQRNRAGKPFFLEGQPFADHHLAFSSAGPYWLLAGLFQAALEALSSRAARTLAPSPACARVRDWVLIGDSHYRFLATQLLDSGLDAGPSEDLLRVGVDTRVRHPRRVSARPIGRRGTEAVEHQGSAERLLFRRDWLDDDHAPVPPAGRETSL